VALQVLQQMPLLWIWDNVEPVAGFPSGTPSAWTADEQRALADWLRLAQGTQARFLLTSRRDERAWLADLPARITLPPLRMTERVQMARAVALKHARPLHDVQAWLPLLTYSEGNPMTLSVVLGQALRDGLSQPAQVAAFVARLRAGEAVLEDDAAQERTRSLGASLAYGLEQAFTPDERRALALLAFFQGFVDVDALRLMGDPRNPGCVTAVRGWTREQGLTLLDRAAEIGLLRAYGRGAYAIHPALPWFFAAQFAQAYGSLPAAAARAFVEAEGTLGDYYHNQYGAGQREVIGPLRAEEANLLHARQVARAHAWPGPVMGAMQGLYTLYDHTGRRAEWARLVQEIVPDFVDLATDGPRAGREDDWSLVTGYRVRLARQARRWAEAERLQRVCVEWDRGRAAAALAAAPQALDDAQHNAIRTLAVSLEQLGQIQREQGSAECVASYKEALPLYQRIANRPEESVLAFNLGHAYKDLPALRDLAQAEAWYQRSLERRDEGDRLGRAKSLGQLGMVAQARFGEARAAARPEEELLRHLNAALQYYQQALALTPQDNVDELAVVHSALGNVFGEAGDLQRALPHYREAIRLFEAAGDLYDAARNRFNVAAYLANAGRWADAREYARAALANFQACEGATDKVQETQGLLAQIEAALAQDAAPGAHHPEPDAHA
jgi:tetratricopeptide (TPR) repeat protein